MLSFIFFSLLLFSLLVFLTLSFHPCNANVNLLCQRIPFFFFFSSFFLRGSLEVNAMAAPKVSMASKSKGVAAAKGKEMEKEAKKSLVSSVVVDDVGDAWGDDMDIKF